MAFFGSTKKIKPAKRLTCSVRVPGDKSISHRYAMLAAIAEGPSEVHYFSSSADCRSTLACLEKLGATIERKDEALAIQGEGLKGLRQPSGRLDAGNSGATMPMLGRLLAVQALHYVIPGGASLCCRPIKRLREPLP